MKLVVKSKYIFIIIHPCIIDIILYRAHINISFQFLLMFLLLYNVILLFFLLFYRLCVVIQMDVLQKEAPMMFQKASSGAAPMQQSPAPQVQAQPKVEQTYGAAGGYGGYSANAPPSAPAANDGGGWNGGYNQNNNNNSKPIVADNFAQQTTPIHALNPYSNRWTIKARITQKQDKKTWNNAKGSGTLFSITIIDENKSEIRGTFFKEACEKFYPQLEEGSVYYFSGGKLKPVANRQFNNTKSDYEITFDQQSQIIAAPEDTKICTQSYEFIKIDQILNIEPNTTVDVIGLVKSCSDVATITSAKMGNKELFKRDLIIMDETLTEIKMTLWGTTAQNENYSWNNHPIVAFKGVKVGDYSGRSLSLLQSGSMSIAPQIPEGQQLLEFMTSKINEAGGDVNRINANNLSSGGPGGSSNRGDSFMQRKLCNIIKEDGLGHLEKPDWVSMKLSCFYIKSDNEPWYTACAHGTDCKKKVIEDMEGNWRCEKCNVSEPKCTRRYVLTTQMGDHSGSNWFSFFDNEATKLIGMSADELHSIKNDTTNPNADDIYRSIINKNLFKQFIIKAKVKAEEVNQSDRVKCTVFSMDNIDYATECTKMIDAIALYQ
jgi:replication factor A1